jgi:hypothetical protein
MKKALFLLQHTVIVTCVMILFTACGKGSSGNLDNMNNGGGGGNPQPTNSGEVLPTAVSSVTSGHATIEGELTKLPGTQAMVQIGFVWDTKSHTNIADYPNTYLTLDKRYPGTFKFIRAGLVGGTTYYVRAVAGKTATGTPLIYGKELSFTTKAPNMEYGEFVNDGILFYVDGTGKHGLVADLDALIYNFGTGPKWGIANYTGDSFVTSKAIGTGNANTNTIVSKFGTPSTIYAALASYNLDKNGHNDWYLPSIDELSQLKKNLYDTPLGLAPGHFWSSTTTVAGEAWCLGTDAVSDAPDQFFISSGATVCSVRSF